jgi:hypothetical protein
MLEAYLGDLTYWCATMDVGGINFVTAGTPEFETIEDANAHRVMVKAILKELAEENALCTTATTTTA